MSDLNVGFGKSQFDDDETLVFGDDEDYSLRYDSTADVFAVRDRTNGADGLRVERNGVVRLGDDLLATDGEVIWDESNGYVPASSVESSAVYSDEKAQDAAASALTGGTGVTVSYDDPNDTITVSGHAKYTDEEAQDTVASALTGGTGITVTYDDANDTITVDGHNRYTDEEAQDATAAALTGGAHASVTYDDVNDTITIDVSDDWVDIGGDTMTGTLDAPTYQLDGSTFAQSIPISGQVTLSSGSAVIDTALSATDATFLLALGVDDPNADTKLSGRLFWDDSAGTYKIEIVETETSVGNPTANYDVVRVR